MWHKLSFWAGILLLSISLFKWKQSIEFINVGERAIGTVISMEEDDGAFSPVFIIETRQQEQVVYHHPVSTSPPSWEVGEEAIFLYDPVNPQEVKMMNYFGLFNWAIVFMGLAIPPIIIGGGYFLFRPLIRTKEER